MPESCGFGGGSEVGLTVVALVKVVAVKCCGCSCWK